LQLAPVLSIGADAETKTFAAVILIPLLPAAKLLYIRYPPIEAKIIANTVRLALEKRDFLKASDFINLLSPRV
jgi:hypothetical protein